MLIKKGRLRLFISNNGGFSFAYYGNDDDPSRVFEVDALGCYSSIYIDFWDICGFELEVVPCAQNDLKENPTIPYHKFIAYLFWGVYGLDLVMKLSRNKWGIPQLSFSKEIYD